MKNAAVLVTGVVLFLLQMDGFGQEVRKKVLIFSKTLRYHHESIEDGIIAIQKLGKEFHFDVDTSTDAKYFTEDTLAQYAAVIFLSPGGNVFDTSQQADFERYIQAGGGYMGIHAATTLEYDWPWYGQLAGAFFNGHPEPQEGVVRVVDSSNAATRHLPKEWKRYDEWYNFKDMVKDVHVLLKVDETTYTSGKLGAWHPVAWYHEFDGGRSFYTALGHFGRAYADPFYLRHILGGIQYAMGNNVILNYSKAKTRRILK